MSEKPCGAYFFAFFEKCFVPILTSGGLAAVSSSAFAALYSAFGKYDVVHIHAEGPAFFAWLPKMFGKRVVVTVHGTVKMVCRFRRMLLLDYICSQCVKHGKMPADPVMVKTIVTMDMGEQIATNYGLRTINVLTGFKFIGEQIGKLEKQGKADSYVFGFEESYGYLTGSYVRDKDGVDGAYMICEMFSYYATKSISLLDELDELYKTYGYCLNTLHSYEFDGSAGFAKMQSIMQAFRGDIEAFGGKKVVKLLDYAPGLDGLPKSDVLKFLLEDNCSIVVRPSGTEPKLKTYISVSAENKEAAKKVEAEIRKSAEEHLK